jgi:hypothetical protein|tara:strand:+ start:395 stop:547 length:153 start_codon:yes stop_codon:yes gene_type:complete
MMRSYILRRRFSATRALVSLSLSSLAIVARMGVKTKNKFFMAGEVRGNGY